eukprot:jgi/Psemu1/291109/fgenesh1_pg.624_\
MNPSSQNFAARSLAQLRAREENGFRHNQSHHEHEHQQNHLQNPTTPGDTRSGISLIQSGSIQNQFTALSNQKENFARERNLAQKELEQIQKDQQSIKTEHDSLVESSRQAKEKLGQGMEKLTMLKEQEARILQLTENEFRAIENCTHHSKMLEHKKEEASKKYTAEMDPLNLELATLLEGRVHKKTERCISLRSIQAVVLPEIYRATKDQNRPQLLNEKENLFNSIQYLKEATTERERIIAHLRGLHGAVNNGLHTLDGDRTTSTGDEFEADTNGQSPMHMDLFYGSSNDE